MIRVKRLQIEEFRGVRILDLDLDGQNFGICGPNGTGKSGVVDAIEFCLTGDVTRLSGQGTAGLSVRSHAPHVDQRSHPEKANVTITADIPSLGKTVKLHRSVKKPNELQITPADPEIERVVRELEMHPEFALSRREIVKYIITPPGQRSVDVQTLLRLDHIERLRKALTTFCNKRKGEAEEAERTLNQAETDLKSSLDIDRLDRVLVLQRINEQRQIVGLQPLLELTKGTSFNTGLPERQEAAKNPAVRKATALADVGALQSAIAGGEPAEVGETRRAIKTALEMLSADERALSLARRHGFIMTGLDLVIEDACPLCDTPWRAEDLREYLRGRLLSAESLASLINDLRVNVTVILELLANRIQAIEHVVSYCQRLQPAVPHAETSVYLDGLKEREAALKGLLEDHSRITPAIKAVTDGWWSPTQLLRARIDECEAALNALPDTSAEDHARDLLSVAQDRYERLLRASTAARMHNDQGVVAQKILDHYNNSATAVLEAIYDDVAKSFSGFYRAINRGDEEKFVGKLTPEPAKLSFDVDFYGRGLFPPGAYHSEGHQDAMGLCLYLALMKHTLGNRFTFAVLDDVLMSIDTGHRREVCRLLRMEFPSTQFILTTHDRLWLQYMKTENLIGRAQTFGGWSVETGPRVWNDHDIWFEIQSALGSDDVPRAAWLLRHYLEYTTVMLADNLRASVEFRGDGHHDLGDLLSPVLSKWKKVLDTGERSAIHWKRDDLRVSVAALRAAAKDLIANTNAEQWVVNPAVHFNEWANFEASEFQQLVDAFKALLDHLRCDNATCGSYFYISPRKGPAEDIRCDCGKTSINLKVN